MLSTAQRSVARNRLLMQHNVVAGRRRANSNAARDRLRSLPRLPVPELRKTLGRYLKSLEPFLLEHEARDGVPFQVAYDARLKLLEDFEQGVGQLCQQRLFGTSFLGFRGSPLLSFATGDLEELDKNSPHNWLDDNIWLKTAYHEWRAPLIVNSNWWLALVDDPAVPQHVRHPQTQRRGFTNWQVRRAAWLVHRTLEFKAQLEK